MHAYGHRLVDGLAEQAKEAGFDVRITGEPVMPYLRFVRDERYERMLAWCHHCIGGGVYFHPAHNWFLTTAHDEDDLARTLDVTRGAFAEVRARFGSD